MFLALKDKAEYDNERIINVSMNKFSNEYIAIMAW